MRGESANVTPKLATSGDGRERWVKRREKWLVVLGVVLHAVYMPSIFDIYLKSPIVHGMDPVQPRFSAPAKRLVLLVADGLRADTFYELDDEGKYRAPFLRSVIKGQGRWGVSHARAPTESRPAHVAIIAGFYEDPSAVKKGWKANPVVFDTVFNRSRHTISYGSPSIVPKFCGPLPNSTWSSYPYYFEDTEAEFAIHSFSDLRGRIYRPDTKTKLYASFLDEWSFDQFESLLNRSHQDLQLKQLLQQDNLIIFLHLNGCDHNGGTHGPYSSFYLSNVKVVDHISERVYNLMKSYFKDDHTSYIFTADHGMSDKGNHGDGHYQNTETPLVVWGAGVKHPMPCSRKNHSSCGVRFMDEQKHDMQTPMDWGLDDFERVDINQADLAPLMTTLLGLPCPVNSVGELPHEYLDFSEADKVEAVLANAKQILGQFLRKSSLRKSTSFRFRPFKPLARYSSILIKIENMISVKDYKAAMELSKNLRSLALKGLDYFQTYDWFMLRTVITLGYTGWMIFIIIHVLQSYTSLPGKFPRKNQGLDTRNNGKVHLWGVMFTGFTFMLLLLDNAPPLYYAYVAMTVFLWNQVYRKYHFMRALLRYLARRQSSYLIKLSTTSVVSVIILEFLVHSFTERKLYTWCFLFVGVVASIHLYYTVSWKPVIAIFLWFACWFLSIFTLMPVEIPDNTLLVVASGAMIIALGAIATYLDLYAEASKYWHGLVFSDLKKPKFPILFLLQALLVAISSVMVPLTTSHRKQKQELLGLHQLVNWFVAGFSIILPLFSATSLLSRLTSVFLGFAPAFLLLSIGYEAVFYAALALVLMAWILYENTLFFNSNVKVISSRAEEHNTVLENYDRGLVLSDMRIVLTFTVLFSVAFFGTANLVSIAHFKISSVYRFITVFSQILMAALLIFKLCIPLMLVVCAFSAITKLIRVPRVGCYFLAISCSDVMTIHFFFLVRNTGSWMEIGNSIGHFGMVSAQVVFILLLFALTNIYTKDIQTGSTQSFSQRKL